MARGVLTHVGFCDYCGAAIFADLWEIDTSMPDLAEMQTFWTCNCVPRLAKEEQGLRQAPH